MSRICALALLLMSSVVAPCDADEEIAVLTIRRDNIHKTTSTELLPIARIEHGRFRPIKGVEYPEKSVCAPSAFRGWAHPGIIYDVLYRGEVVGTARSVKQAHESYDCSELCVVRAATSLKERAPSVETQRKGFDESTFFDESISQYAAYASTDGKRPFSSRTTAPLDSSVRSALLEFVSVRMAGKAHKASARRVSMDAVEPFIASRAGEINIFVSAVLKQPGGALRAISTVVQQRDDGTFESLFELMKDGDEDWGAAYYELIEAADFDGDGLAELLVGYHNYEFHEFQILKRNNARFQIVHKGPTYGC